MRATWVLLLLLAAAPVAGAAEPDLPSPEPSYTRAYVVGGLGLALTGLSFWLAEEADRAYADYQQGSDLDALLEDYDRSIRLDRLSAGALLAGQAGLALGIYWRFLRRPRAGAAFRYDASARLEPLPYPGGLAVRLRF